MKRNVMNVFVSVCVVFVMVGWITMQFADAATVSHKGTAMVKAIGLEQEHRETCPWSDCIA
ncbi:hypothetical protein [Nitrosomonas communis]|uniref:hypothetical protein n=1 Tax=Nitrosomonas communis TaxID=44574 RepID=UPI003D2B2977